MRRKKKELLDRTIATLAGDKKRLYQIEEECATKKRRQKEIKSTTIFFTKLISATFIFSAALVTVLYFFSESPIEITLGNISEEDRIYLIQGNPEINLRYENEKHYLDCDEVTFTFKIRKTFSKNDTLEYFITSGNLSANIVN